MICWRRAWPPYSARLPDEVPDQPFPNVKIGEGVFAFAVGWIKKCLESAGERTGSHRLAFVSCPREGEVGHLGEPKPRTLRELKDDSVIERVQVALLPEDRPQPCVGGNTRQRVKERPQPRVER